MFDALLRSKFYSKCKSEIKQTRRRIEIIKRKRNAMQKFLRNDVADLLKKGLDSNAYGRIEQLYVDQNMSSCYEFVEQSCLLILTHLSAMDKQRDCPDECKEAISTLMFAAARFADLPELRELRSLFAERYGNLLDPYVNKEFVKNLKAETPTEDIKHLMMLDIKLEYDIEWDNNKAHLEQKLYKPPPFVQDSPQHANERTKEPHKSQHQIIGQDTVFQKQENKKTQVAKKENNNTLEKKFGQGRGSPYWSSTSSCSSDTTTTSQEDNSSSASEDGLERRKFNPKFKEDDNTLQGKKTNSLRSVGPPYMKTQATSSNTVTPTPKQVPRSVRIRRPFKPVSGSQCHNEVSKQTPVVFDDVSDDVENKRKLGCDSRHVPTRISSLPVESSSGIEESRKEFVRAVTDVSRGQHVHPKLPDYDDFVAKLAAYRAGS